MYLNNKKFLAKIQFFYQLYFISLLRDKPNERSSMLSYLQLKKTFLEFLFYINIRKK